MLAVRLIAAGDLRLVEVPKPAPAPGEVLVQVAAAGICGTDRHLYHGTFPCIPPVTLGHEFSGPVVAVGTGVSLPVGTLVTCDPNIACGTCGPCLKGRINLCRNLLAVGIGRDGGFAEYCAFPAHRALPLPPGLDPRHGAFCEPLACCLHGIDIGAPKPGERAIILGGGVIGLLTLQLALLAGTEAMLITRQAEKRQVAARLGAHATAATPQEAQALWPDGADLVLECAGVTETVEACPALAARGGRIVVLGVVSHGDKARIEPFDLLFREVSLLFAFINPFTQSRAGQLISSGRVKLDALISSTISLAQAVDAISHDPRPGEIKVMVVPEPRR